MGVLLLWSTCLVLLASARPPRQTPLSPTFPKYQEKWFNQTLDHFRFSAPTVKWSHRYLFNDDYWTGKGRLPNGCKGPILFYTGNEGPIDAFWGSNGFMIEVLAPKWGGLLVFGEERFYGKSLPFGKASLDPDHAVYLSTEQVLADYAALITHLKDTLPGAKDCPVVAFGGSYGGTLTTYFRLRYPQIVVGGLGASAPIGYYANNGWSTHGVDAYTWIDIVNKDYHDAHPKCLSALTATVSAVASIGSTAAGRDRLGKAFHLCNASLLGGTPTDFLTDALETMPQEDYPYAIGSLPAWPVNATCDIITRADPTNPDSLLAAAVNITDMYYGYTQGGACLDVEGQGGIPGGGPGPASWGSWGYQSCTETLHQFSARGMRSFTFSMAMAVAQCHQYYNVTPNPLWGELHFGGFAIGDGIMGITNIIWSNGLLDPWHGGGFLTVHPEMKSKGVHWLFMAQGAHHLDLRGPHPEDPAEVTAVRAQEEAILWGFIQEASRV